MVNKYTIKLMTNLNKKSKDLVKVINKHCHILISNEPIGPAAFIHCKSGARFIIINPKEMIKEAKKSALDLNTFFMHIISHEYGHFIDVEELDKIKRRTVKKRIENEETAWAWAIITLAYYGIDYNEKVINGALNSHKRGLRRINGIA